MPLPSFDYQWRGDQRLKPRILVLEIKDKERPEAGAIAWLLVEREENYNRNPIDGTLHDASIRLTYQRITPKFSSLPSGGGFFAGCYSQRAKAVSITSPTMGRGFVTLDLPRLNGQYIGTYLMNEVVAWVKQWPDATVNSVELLENQGNGENKERRNRLYEQFGLVFDYADQEKRAGLSREMPAADLRAVETWKDNIKEHWVVDYLSEVLYAKERAETELQFRDRACKEFADRERKAAERPIRWAMRQLGFRLEAPRPFLLALAVVVVILLVKLG